MWKFLHSVPAVLICLSICSAFEQNGIRDAPIISAGDHRYKAFKRIDDALQEWMDTSLNPCDDFYGYTCKKGQEAGLTPPRTKSNEHNMRIQMEKFKDEHYFLKAPTPLKQLKHLYQKCVNSDATMNEAMAVYEQRIEEIKNESGVSFPMLYQNETVEAITRDQLSRLIGLEISENGENSALFKLVVLRDDKQYDKQQLSEIRYHRYTDDEKTQPAMEHLRESAHMLGLELDEDQLQNDVAMMLEFSKTLPARYSYGEDSAEQWKLSDLQNTDNSVNWLVLVKAALKRSTVVHTISPQTSILIQGQSVLRKIIKNLSEGKIAPSTVANYLFFRSTLETKKTLNYLTRDTRALASDNVLPARMKSDISTSCKPHSHEYLTTLLKDEYSEKQLSCLHILLDLTTMQQAADRLFADAAFPTKKAKLDTRNNLSKLIEYVRTSFRMQLDTINWMSEETKKEAYEKLEKMKIYAAYPEWLEDDTMLTEYYKDLHITENSSTIEARMAKSDFYNLVLSKKDNLDFFGSVRETNSRYKNEPNAAFIYGGMLNDVFYNPDYPSPYNFGALATVIGHELVHGFDSSGVNFDANGTQRQWMDIESNESFDKMAQCIEDEYSHFCLRENVCLSGSQTKDENIADNGGMQAAYKAFKHFESLNGPEPRLPSKFGRVFTNDQLYFLGFAHSWCKEVLNEFDGNNHSPNMYRVQGTLQNFPAFRAAFNCPVNRNYTPEVHCNVWTSPPFK